MSNAVNNQMKYTPAVMLTAKMLFTKKSRPLESAFFLSSVVRNLKAWGGPLGREESAPDTPGHDQYLCVLGIEHPIC